MIPFSQELSPIQFFFLFKVESCLARHQFDSSLPTRATAYRSVKRSFGNVRQISHNFPENIRTTATPPSATLNVTQTASLDTSTLSTPLVQQTV